MACTVEGMTPTDRTLDPVRAAIREEVAGWPPLTPAQLSILAAAHRTHPTPQRAAAAARRAA